MVESTTTTSSRHEADQICASYKFMDDDLRKNMAADMQIID